MYFGLDNMIFWTWLRSLYQFTCKIYYGICLGGEILLEVETCYLVQVIFHIPSLVSSKDDKPSKPWGGRRQNKWWNHFRYVMESCILIAKTSRRHSQANVPRGFWCAWQIVLWQLHNTRNTCTHNYNNRERDIKNLTGFNHKVYINGQGKNKVSLWLKKSESLKTLAPSPNIS